MICNHSRIATPGNAGTTSSPKTINGDQNGTYLSVNLATDSLSIQRVKLNRVLPPATGEGRDGGDAYCEDTPHPSLPPQLRGKEPHRHAITVITVEKLSIRRLSKCHSAHTPLSLRLTVVPGEAYLAPTYNLIHDATTVGKTAPDLTYGIAGRFSMIKLLNEWGT